MRGHTLVFDECVGGRRAICRLRSLGWSVELLTDHFAPGTPDTSWIPEVAQRGWVIVTRDRRIRSRPA